jgi:anaerobic selenocysteine-containing dehydrogenase
MHVLFTEGLADDEFLASECDGADELRARAMEWALPRAARATGLAEQDIVDFARLLAAGPAFVKVGPGAQRHADAGEGVRAAIMLPAVTGAWRHRGGGALVASAGVFPMPERAMARPDLRGDRPKRAVNMVQLGRALAGELDDGAPPITALLVYAANPMVVAPDTNAVRAGMQRDDLFTVVLEQFPTETALLADVVLPATTQLEHLDVVWSWGHQYLTLNRPAVAPRGQSRPNTEIFRMLAATMADVEPALRDDSLRDDDETLLATYLAAYPASVHDELFERGWVKWAPPPAKHPPKIALRSNVAASLGLGAVPIARDPDDDDRVVVLTPKSHHFLNSQFVNHERLRHMAGDPQVIVASSDATSRAIADGDRVRLRNEHGEVAVVATVSDDVPAGTVVLLSNWWQRDLPGGAAANALTGQDLADLGGAPILTPRAELLLAD